nr:helix-turn-helix domain-containing protein [Tumebacillus flagellatus]
MRELRKERRLKQKDIADAVGIGGLTTYNGYENDKREPNNEMLVKLANLFGVTTDYLLGRTDDRTGGVEVPTPVSAPTPAPPSDQRVLEYLARLERKLDALAGEIVELRESGFGKLADQIEEHDTDIRMIKKLLTKE